MNSEIYNVIKNRVLFFEYFPGQLLNEKALSDEFGVSRTPLREVFIKLEAERLLTIMPRAGIMVTLVEFQKLRNVFEIRVQIEGLIGKLAAERISDEQLEKMREILSEGKKLLTNRNPIELVNTDIKFREAFNLSINNMILKEVSDYLYNLTLRVWFMIFDKVNWSEEVNSELKEIEETIEILRKRNPQEAERFRRNIIINYVERIKINFSG